MFKIYEVSQRMDLLDDAVQHFWSKWSNTNNFNFYKDSITNSLDPTIDLSKFFIAVQGEKIMDRTFY